MSNKAKELLVKSSVVISAVCVISVGLLIANTGGGLEPVDGFSTWLRVTIGLIATGLGGAVVALRKRL